MTMLYDIRLTMRSDYDWPVSGGRHLLRLTPVTLPGRQRVIASSLAIEPQPAERRDTPDFFRNMATAIALREPHQSLDFSLKARVRVERPQAPTGLSALAADLPADIAGVRSLGPEAPHHFLAPSPMLPPHEPLAAWARQAVRGAARVLEVAEAINKAVHEDFDYDPEATLVDTPVAEAFALRRGVCQDFAHVMILGLRSLGVPAAYVSGFLRTIPPPGKEPLEGADAMHAWVRVWCGREIGWVEFDPTNDMRAGDDHIVVAWGRDYGDALPVVGVLRSSGGQEVSQAVDVKPVAE